MDANTVQEIANQFGISVDQILQYLPAYAQAKFMGMFIPIMFWFIVFIFSLIGCITVIILRQRAFNMCNLYKHTKYSKEKEDTFYEAKKLVHKYEHLYSKYDSFLTGIGAVAIFSLIVTVIGFSICLEPMIGWTTSPEIMLLNSLIS